MSVGEKAFNGIATQTFITLLLAVIDLVYFSMMSRLLSPTVFGELAIVMAVVSILQSLSDAGLGSAIIQRKDSNPLFVSTAFTLSIGLGILFCIILFVLSPFFSYFFIKSYDLTNAFRICSISFLLQASYNVYRSQLIKELKFKLCGFITITSTFVACSVGVLMAYKGFEVYSILLASIINQVMAMILFYCFKEERIAFKIKLEYIRSIFSYGGWLTGAVLVRSFTTQVDKMIIARWLPITDLGALNRPSGFITKITGTINSIFDTVLFPILSPIQDDVNKAKYAYIKLNNLIVVFSVWLTTGFIVTTDLTIDIFFGHQWTNLKPIFYIISLSVLFLGYSQIGDCFFRSLGIVKSYFLLRIAVCAVTLISVYIGCQSGLVAVAVAVTLSRLFDSAIKFFILKHKLQLSYTEIIIPLFKTLWITVILCLTCLIVYRYSTIFAIILFLVLFGYSAIVKPSIWGSDYRTSIYPQLQSKIPFFKKFNN